MPCCDGIENLAIGGAGIGAAGNGKAGPELARRAIGAVTAGAGGIEQTAAFVDRGLVAGEGIARAGIGRGPPLGVGGADQSAAAR